MQTNKPLKKVASNWFRQIYYYGLGATRLDDDVEDYELSTWYQSYLVPMTKLLSANAFAEEPFSTQTAEKLLYATELLGSLEDADAYLRKCCDTQWYYILPIIIQQMKTLPSELQERMKLFVSVFKEIKENCDSIVVSFDVNYMDTEILVDSETQKPVGLYPTAYVAYPEVWCIKAGGHELARLNKASYASLNTLQIQFLRDAVKEGVLPKEDLAEYRILVPVKRGVVDYVNYNILSDDLPPAELLTSLQLVPESLVNKYGDPYTALNYLAHNDTLGDYITQDVLDYLSSISWFFDEQVSQDVDKKESVPIDFMNPCVAETPAYITSSSDKAEVESLLKDGCNSADELTGIVASYPEMTYKVLMEWRDKALCPHPEPVADIREVPVEKVVEVNPIENRPIPTRAAYVLWDAVRKTYEQDDSSVNHERWFNVTRCLFRITQGRYTDITSILSFFDRYAEKTTDEAAKAVILEAREIIASDNPGL